MLHKHLRVEERYIKDLSKNNIISDIETHEYNLKKLSVG